MIDIERRLISWADWYLRRDNGGTGWAKECSYTKMQARSNHFCGTPEINEDAYETERAVQSMAAIPRMVIIETYMRGGTVGMKCKRLGISYNTLAKYLDQAHAHVSEHILKNSVDIGVRKSL